jgi:putative flippase GtrA
MSDSSRPSLARRLRSLLEIEIVRYGLIGVVNTVFGYGVFVGLQLTLGQVIQYTIVQVISNLIAIVEAYWLQRWLVFRHQGGWWVGLAKFASVYAGAFFFSLAMVALLVEVFKVNVLVAGAITIVLQTVGTYSANKWFTFRSGGGPQDGPPRSAGDAPETNRIARLPAKGAIA